MSKKIRYSNEAVKAKVILDFLPQQEELSRMLLEDVQRRSAEFDAGRMKSIPAEEVF